MNFLYSCRSYRNNDINTISLSLSLSLALSVAAPTLYLLFLGGGGSGNSSINELCHYIMDYITTKVFAHVFAIDGWGLLLSHGSVCLETGEKKEAKVSLSLSLSLSLHDLPKT